MDSENRLNELFAKAKTEKPKVTFLTVRDRFISTTTFSLLHALILKWILLSKQFKIIIMTSIISSLLGIGLAINAFQTPEISPINLYELQKTKTIVNNNQENRSEDKQLIFLNKKKDSIENIVDIKKDSEKIEPIIDDKRNIHPAINLDSKKSNYSLVKQKAPTQSFVKSTKLIKNLFTLDSIEYTISEQTHMNKLEEISEMAKKAGIEIEYKAKVKDNNVRKITISLRIIKNDNTESDWQIKITNGKNPFSFNLGWYYDREGNAIRFLDSMLYGH